MGNCNFMEEKDYTLSFDAKTLKMINNLNIQYPKKYEQNHEKYTVATQKANFKEPTDSCHPQEDFQYQEQDATLYGPFIFNKNNKRTLYYGGMQNNYRNGPGIQFWENGSSYQGSWKNDQPNGKGRFIDESGNTYEGEWKNQKAEGKGVFYQVDGGIIEGEWKNDFQEGYGSEKWPDGTSY